MKKKVYILRKEEKMKTGSRRDEKMVQPHSNHSKIELDDEMKRIGGEASSGDQDLVKPNGNEDQRSPMALKP